MTPNYNAHLSGKTELYGYFDKFEKELKSFKNSSQGGRAS
jgi:hypothetical protein